VRERWGVGPEQVARVRRRLIAGEAASAEADVPRRVMEDLAADPDPEVAGAIANRIGATGLALPVTDVATVGDRVAWARRVLAVHP